MAAYGLYSNHKSHVSLQRISGLCKRYITSFTVCDAGYGHFDISKSVIKPVLVADSVSGKAKKSRSKSFFKNGWEFSTFFVCDINIDYFLITVFQYKHSLVLQLVKLRHIETYDG